MERASNLGSIFAGGFGSCFSLSSFVKKCEECVFFSPKSCGKPMSLVKVYAL